MPSVPALLLAAVVAGVAEPVSTGAAQPALVLDHCDALVRAQPADPESYSCFRAAAHRQGRRAAAVAWLDALLRRQPDNHWARLTRAHLDAELRRRSAEPLYRAAVAGFSPVREREDEGSRRGAVEALTGLGRFLAAMGRTDEALAVVEEARSTAGRSVDPALALAVRLAQARLATAQSDPGRVWALLESIDRRTAFLNIPGRHWRFRLELEYLSTRGFYFWATGRLEDAREAYEELRQLTLRAEDRFEEAGALHNLAIAAPNPGPGWSPERRKWVMAALEAARESGNRRIEAAARLSLGQDPDAALSAQIEQIEQALEFLRGSTELGDTCFALRLLATKLLIRHPKEPVLPLRLADEAVARARRGADNHHLARGLLVRAQLLMKAGPHERAVKGGLEALAAIERLRDLQPDTLVRARVGAQWTLLYHRFSGYLLDRADDGGFESDLDLGFVVMERLRARILLDAMDAAQVTPAVAGRHPLAAERALVLAEIAKVQRQLMAQGPAASEQRGTSRELERLEAREAVLRDAIARADPGFRTLRQPAMPSLADVRRGLADDQALLAFQMLDDWTVANLARLLVVTPSGVRVYRLPHGAPLSEAIGLLPAVMDRRDGSETAGAVRLYADLLARALEELSPRVTRLVIVPDGSLHRLPFEALRPSREGPSLTERFEVTIAPSAGLWLRLQARAPARGRALLAIADPELPPLEDAGLRESPAATNARLGRLPHGRREARRAVAALGPDSRLLVGAEATERALKAADLRPFGLVHLAAHAVVDDDHPERTAVVLAVGESGEDGLLQSREVVDLDLAGRVVVLSACRTSGGAILGGEGAMSLARAFFQAGARTVVASLWPVRDDETEALMAAFYGHLADGRSVAGALAAARRQRIRSGAPSAAWAHMVVMGNGEAVTRPPVAAAGGGTSSYPRVLGLALGALALGAWAARRRTGRAQKGSRSPA